MGISLSTIGKVASIATTIGSHIDLSDIKSGIDLSNISPSSASGISDKVVNKLTEKASTITSDLTGIKLDGLNAESLASNLNIESKVDQVMADIESKAQAAATSSNPSDYESLMNGMDIEGQMNQLMNETLSGMGLDSIKHM